MSRKKAIIASQFNWLFILIVGVVILTFFLTSSRQQGKNADVELAINFMKHLDPIISASERSPGTLQKIRMPEMPINFVCEESYSVFMVGEGYEQDITHNIIFSANEIDHSFLFTWSLDWKTPYKVASFLYLTTPNTKFYFVNETSGATTIEQLYAGFPNNLTAEIVNIGGSISNEGYDRYIIVYFDAHNDVKAILNHLPDDKVFGVQITPSEYGLYGYGTIVFTKGRNLADTGESVYLGLPLLYGALFAEDIEYYDCTLMKAMRRLKLVNKLNWDRTELIKSKFDFDPFHPCLALYVLPLGAYGDIDTAVDLEDITQVDMGKIYQQANYLKLANEDLKRGAACPLLY